LWQFTFFVEVQTLQQGSPVAIGVAINLKGSTALAASAATSGTPSLCKMHGSIGAPAASAVLVGKMLGWETNADNNFDVSAFAARTG